MGRRQSRGALVVKAEIWNRADALRGLRIIGVEIRSEGESHLAGVIHVSGDRDLRKRIGDGANDGNRQDKNHGDAHHEIAAGQAHHAHSPHPWSRERHPACYPVPIISSVSTDQGADNVQSAVTREPGQATIPLIPTKLTTHI